MTRCLAVILLLMSDDFAETRLRHGEDLLRLGQPALAAEDLRIAAFGLLDRPDLYCESLAARVAAESAAGDSAAADAALDRWIQVRRGYPACRGARVDPAWRDAIQRVAGKRMSQAALRELLEARPAAPPVPGKVAADAISPPPPIEPSKPTATPPPPAARVVSPPPSPAETPSAPAQRPAPAAAAAPSSGPTPVPSDELDRQPQILHTFRAAYPESALRSRVGGIVLLRVLVSENGAPLEVVVARSVRRDLDDAAVAAVRRWVFEPGRKVDSAVRAWMTVAVPFDLPRS